MWGQIQASAFLHQQSCNKLRLETSDHRLGPLRYLTFLSCDPPINKNAHNKVHFEVRLSRKVFLKSIVSSLLYKLIEKSECFRRWGDVSKPVGFVVWVPGPVLELWRTQCQKHVMVGS